MITLLRKKGLVAFVCVCVCGGGGGGGGSGCSACHGLCYLPLSFIGKVCTATIAISGLFRVMFCSLSNCCVCWILPITVITLLGERELASLLFLGLWLCGPNIY